MKVFLLLIFFFSFLVDSFSQDISDNLLCIPNPEGKNLPTDQVFLHVDRNFFQPGDTLRFQAYIRDRQTGIIETNSISLYSILLNSSNQTIDSARFRISSALSSGWLTIPDTVSPGYYKLISFTSDMMNYDPSYIFSAPLRIGKTKPNKSKTISSRSINNSPAYQTPLNQQNIDLRFLPEGGTFIYGIRQRLAFNTITSLGRTLKVRGGIYNQNGDKICDFESDSIGPGLVEFTPIQGDFYYAILYGEEFTGMKWSLPDPEEKGISLRVNNNENGLLDIRIDGKRVSERTWYLTFVMNNVMVMSKAVKVDTLLNISISTKQLPTGTAFLTISDIEYNPVAERLVMVNAQEKMDIEISLPDNQYHKGDETELTISAFDKDRNSIGAVISVSVIDSISGYCSSLPLKDIESTFLYDKDFYDKLPSKIRMEGLSNICDKDLDLLLMTYGWRKFAVKKTSNADLTSEIKNYDYLKIFSPAKRKKVRDEILIMGIEGSEVYRVEPDKNNESILRFDILDESARQIMILPDENTSKNINPVTIEFSQNIDFTDKAKLLFNDFNYSTAALSDIIKEDLVIQEELDFSLDGDSGMLLNNVIVRGNRIAPRPHVDTYKNMFRYAGATTMHSKDFATSINFQDIVTKMHPYKHNRFDMTVTLRPSASFTLLEAEDGLNKGVILPSNALFIVDDVMYGKSYSSFSNMPASEIASVTVLRGVQGFARYGSIATGGVIFVTTKSRLGLNNGTIYEDESGVNTDQMTHVRLFRTEVEYYVPTKDQVAYIPEYQERPTLLWKKDIFIDGSEPVKIKYPNNLVKGAVMVIVNGVSFTDHVGSNKCSYRVK
jgi:hypothetical protein